MTGEWAARGRQIATERYDRPRVARRVEALYREVAAGDPAACALVTT